MTRVDFRDPSILERLWCTIKDAITSRNPAIFLGVLLGLLFVAEGTRLIVLQGRLWGLEARRDHFAARVAADKTRATALHDLERLLAQALRLRRTNARLAREIAEIGNTLPPDLALTTLRNTEIGQPAQTLELDGRTTSVADIVKTLRRLSVTGNLELQRDDSTDGAISFRLGLNPGPRQ